MSTLPVCSPGFGLVNNVCVQCIPGTYSPGGSVACSLSPQGYYVPTSGASTYSLECAAAIIDGAAACNPMSIECTPYAVSDTYFGTQNYETCLLYACPGANITASMCGAGQCFDDPALYLHLSSDPSAEKIASSDDVCDSCPFITHTLTGVTTCQHLSLREACYGMSSCSGQVSVTGVGNCRAGQYFNSSVCVDVPTGYYNPTAGVGSSYYYCQYSHAPGAVSCFPDEGLCVPGQYFDGADCVPVPIGYYNPFFGTANYYICDYAIAPGYDVCELSVPSFTPTLAPTSAEPTPQPSFEPTVPPTASPTASPTLDPTVAPTYSPSAAPSDRPTLSPTDSPTAPPTVAPSASPTEAPTLGPGQCYPGNYFVVDACVPCPAGTYSPHGMNCTLSPAGFYIPSPGQSTYSENCTFSTKPGAAVCLDDTVQCTAGKYFNSTGCDNVPLGYYTTTGNTYYFCPLSLEEGAATCYSTADFVGSCGAGRFINGTRCDPVPSGYYNPFNNSGVFYVCPYAVVPGSSNCGAPTPQPTAEPSAVPTPVPSFVPSASPTDAPTDSPTAAPSAAPTAEPTASPTTSPTNAPTASPTSAPTTAPTPAPSADPSSMPSCQPSSQPSSNPSMDPTSQPSSQPSSYPSTQPTGMPSAVPSATPTALDRSLVPQISAIDVREMQTSVFLTVHLYSDVGMAGDVHCTAFNADTWSGLSSVEQIFSSGGVTSNMPFHARVVNVTIPNLVASTPYQVRCAVTNTYGYRTALASVGRVSIFTKCCKALVLTAVPSFVFLDPKRYTAQTSFSKQITFQLSNPPRFYPLRISPVLTLEGSSSPISASILSVSSPSFVLSAADTSNPSLQFSFSLIGSPTYQQAVTVQFNVTGLSASEYSLPALAGVQIYSSGGALPAPTMTSVLFDGSGSFVTISFDGVTDLAQISGSSWSCSRLFLFTGSDSSVCFWSSMSTVLVKFPDSYDSSALLVPFSPVTLRGGLLRAQCVQLSACGSNAAAPMAVVNATVPDQLISPVVILNAPSSISYCDRLTIDPTSSSGSGGRPWHDHYWVVREGQELRATAQALALENALNAMDVLGLVVVPADLMVPGTYTFALVLENFLGSSSYAQMNDSAVTVYIASNPYIPVVSIPGSKHLEVPISSAISVQSVGRLSSCAPQMQLSFAWMVERTSSGEFVSAESTSLNPRAFSLSPYTLDVGVRYRLSVLVSVVVNASYSAKSSAQVFLTITQGPVTATIAGGLSRVSPVDQVLTLDGSASTDSNIPPGDVKTLTYSWTCRIATASVLFGSDCGSFVFSKTKSNSSVLVIPANTLVLNNSYEFTLTAMQTDGRQGSSSVTVTTSAAGSPLVALRSAVTVVNANYRITMNGVVSSGVDSLCSWSVSFASSPVVVSATTPLTQTVASGFNKQFPLALRPDSLIGGRQYTFRLTSCSSLNPQACSSAEMVVTVNNAPSNGKVTCLPVEGVAYSDSFTISAVNWLDDPADFPLLYQFNYRLQYTMPPLSISAQSTITNVASVLPAGVTADRSITIIALVADRYLAGTNATTSVIVKDNANANLTDIFNQRFTSVQLTGDAQSLYQIVNAISSTTNAKNCSAAPKCSQLNRDDCLGTPNTCESCKSGFVGVVGASNAPCFNLSVVRIGQLGDSCVVDGDCLYNECNRGVCVAPPLLCKSNVLSSVCSGHGVCQYVDDSGGEVELCTVLDPFCKAQCVCGAGYGGDSCALTADDAAAASAIRVAMCDALWVTAQTQEKSAELIDSLSNSLLVVFDPNDVVSTQGLDSCLKVLSFISTTLSLGYLDGLQTSTLQSLLQVSSLFVTGSKNSSAAVDFALSSFTTAVGNSLVGGESAEYVTENIRTSIKQVSVESLANSSLSPPATAKELAYGVAMPEMKLPGAGLSACSFSGDYAQLSVTKWGTNPYQKSSSLKSSLLRTTISSSSGATSSRRLVSSSSTESGSGSQAAYFITLPFFKKQDFNFTAIREGNRFVNWTLPDCSFFDGDAYTACSGCNVSTFTNMNVTFACYDISLLCGAAGSDVTPASRNRALGSTVDQKTSDAESSITSYAALLKTVVAEIAKTLSLNPFAIDLNKAKAVLIFVGILAFVVIVGVLHFTRWDARDHSIFVYVQEAKVIDAEKNAEDSTPLKDRVKKVKVSEAFTVNSRLRDLYNYFNIRKQKRSPQDGVDVDADADVKIEDNHSPLGVNERTSSFHNFMKRTESFFVGTKQEEPKVSVDSANAIASSFFEAVMPPNSLLARGYFLEKALDAVLTYHTYLCMFAPASRLESRTVRWIMLCKTVLLALFVNTLFFGIYYPDNKTCSLFATPDECTSEPSKIAAGTSMCEWSEIYEGCILRPPPQNVIFTVVSTLLVILVKTPIEVFLSVCIMEVGSKRPDLEQVGLSSNAFLGSGKITIFEDAEDDMQSALESVLTVKSVGDLESSIAALESKIAGGNGNEPSALERIRKTNKKNMSRKGRKKLKKVKKELKADKHLGKNVLSAAHLASLLTEAEVNVLCGMVYEDLKSPLEEVDAILHKVRDFFDEDLEAPFWKSFVDSKGTDHRRDARVKAISQNLGVYPDGNPQPLSLFDWLLYGTRRNQLAAKINAMRKKSVMIGKQQIQLRMMGFHDSLDSVLIQHFILERVNILKQFCLKKQFFQLNKVSPGSINAFVWIGVWTFLCLVICFFIYWIFAWGVNNGGSTLKGWGLNFMTIVAQDIFLVQPIKVIIIFVVATEAMKPQLRAIHRTLSSITMTYVQDDSDRRNDLRVVQHFCASCRAARMEVTRNLPAAFILRQVDDADVESCNVNRQIKMGIFVVILIAIPVILMVLDDGIAEQAFSTLITSTGLGFIIVNSILLSIGPLIICIPYFVLLGYLIHRYFLLDPAVRRVRYLAQQNGGLKKNWQMSKRSRSVRRNWFEGAVVRIYDDYSIFIVKLANPWSFFNEDGLDVRPEDRDVWMRMNAPPILQAVVPGKHDLKQSDKFSHITGSDERVYGTGAAMLPVEITNMRPRQIAKYDNAAGFDVCKNRDMFGFVELSDVSALIKLKDDNSIYDNDRHSKKAKQFRDRFVTSDVHLAIERLHRDRFTYSDAKYLKDYVDEMMGEDVPIVQVLVAFNEVWNYFYPDGVPLTPREKSEATDAFLLWAFENSVPSSIWTGEAEHGNHTGELVRFSDFLDWFLDFYACFLIDRADREKAFFSELGGGGGGGGELSPRSGEGEGRKREEDSPRADENDESSQSVDEEVEQFKRKVTRAAAAVPVPANNNSSSSSGSAPIVAKRSVTFGDQSTSNKTQSKSKVSSNERELFEL